jgi:hypothetical protein
MIGATILLARAAGRDSSPTGPSRLARAPPFGKLPVHGDPTCRPHQSDRPTPASSETLAFGTVWPGSCCRADGPTQPLVRGQDCAHRRRVSRRLGRLVRRWRLLGGPGCRPLSRVGLHPGRLRRPLPNPVHPSREPSDRPGRREPGRRAASAGEFASTAPTTPTPTPRPQPWRLLGSIVGQPAAVGACRQVPIPDALGRAPGATWPTSTAQ